MSDVTKENIYDFFKQDCLAKHEFALIAEAGAKEAIQDLCGYSSEPFTPERLRAAWNFYISDKKEVEFGISIKRFTDPRVLMKFAARIQKPRVGTQSKFAERYYRCENLWGDCGTAERILVLDDGDVFPDCLEAPCGHCDGRMMKVENVPIPTVADEPSKPVFDDLVPAPPSVVSLPAVSSGELSDCAPLVEWGDVDVGDEGEDDGILF